MDAPSSSPAYSSVSSSHGPERVSIVCGSAFHSPTLAAGLERLGMLERVVTGYPTRASSPYRVPRSKIELARWSLLLNRASARVMGARAVALGAWLNYGFGHVAARKLGHPTLVHGWSGYSREAMISARKRGIRFVLERTSVHIATQLDELAHEAEVLGVRAGQPERAWIWRDEEEYELADLIVVPSSYVRASFLERGFDPARIHLAPLGVDLASFLPNDMRDGRFRVVYAGALSMQKGVHYALKALRIAAIPRSELVLCGGEVPETARVLEGADGRVVRTGHLSQERLLAQYQRSSVFVMPSVQDGFGMVLAQALASGLPVIATTNTGGPDLLRLGGAEGRPRGLGIMEYPAGYVVPVRSAEAIAQCMVWLAEDPTLLQAKRASAARIRESDLGWEYYLERVLQGYRAMRTSAAPVTDASVCYAREN
jgi:alpha-maltose-1-phosphate synthase